MKCLQATQVAAYLSIAVAVHDDRCGSMSIVWPLVSLTGLLSQVWWLTDWLARTWVELESAWGQVVRWLNPVPVVYFSG